MLIFEPVSYVTAELPQYNKYIVEPGMVIQDMYTLFSLSVIMSSVLL